MAADRFRQLPERRLLKGPPGLHGIGADFIRRHGILQPLTVRRTAAGWELVAGERRLRAAVLAGLETVQMCIRDSIWTRCSAIWTGR